MVPLSPWLAKLVLRFSYSKHFIVVCKGYNEDYQNFTELVWQDDKYLCFFDRKTYPKFQLWHISRKGN